MTSLVFDNLPRHDRRARAFTEPLATFLDRVEDPYFEQVRTAINLWCSDYCPVEQPEMAQRLRSADDATFQAAYWELLLHRMLRSLAGNVECHPPLPNSEKTADFLVPLSEPVFVEATLAADTMETPGESTRRSWLIEELNTRLTSPDFFLGLTIQKENSEQPPVTQIAANVQSWVDDLDWGAEHQRLAASGSLLDAQPLIWADRGWILEFRPLPKKESSRGDSSHRPIGMHGPSSCAMITHSGRRSGRRPAGTATSLSPT